MQILQRKWLVEAILLADTLDHLGAGVLTGQNDDGIAGGPESEEHYRRYAKKKNSEIANQSYEELLQDRLLKPYKMKNSTTQRDSLNVALVQGLNEDTTTFTNRLRRWWKCGGMCLHSLLPH